MHPSNTHSLTVNHWPDSQKCQECKYAIFTLLELAGRPLESEAVYICRNNEYADEDCSYQPLPDLEEQD